MTDLATIRKLATLPTRTVPLCVAGELVEEVARLERDLAAVKAPTSLGDGGDRRSILEQIVAVQEQMRGATVEFHLRALPSKPWTEFWARWPNRNDAETAPAFSARRWPAYLELVSRTCVDPHLAVEDVEELAGLLHGSAWSTLVNECLALNMGEVDVPNFDAASELTGDSEQM